jgi:hypothetical protein
MEQITFVNWEILVSSKFKWLKLKTHAKQQARLHVKYLLLLSDLKKNWNFLTAFNGSLLKIWRQFAALQFRSWYPTTDRWTWPPHRAFYLCKKHLIIKLKWHKTYLFLQSKSRSIINVCHILSFVRLSRVLGFSTRATVSTSNASLQTATRRQTMLFTKTSRHKVRHADTKCNTEKNVLTNIIH